MGPLEEVLPLTCSPLGVWCHSHSPPHYPLEAPGWSCCGFFPCRASVLLFPLSGARPPPALPCSCVGELVTLTMVFFLGEEGYTWLIVRPPDAPPSLTLWLHRAKPSKHLPANAVARPSPPRGLSLSWAPCPGRSPIHTPHPCLLPPWTLNFLPSPGWSKV